MNTESLQWFRLYAGIVDDEKLRLLAFEDRWHYVAILALKADGLLDKAVDLPMLNRYVAAKLGLQMRELEAVANRLEEVGLIDAETFQPLAWDKRQFKSDSSTDRVRAFRERKKQAAATPPDHVTAGNVSVTPPETETETETDSVCVGARAREDDPPEPAMVGTFEGQSSTLRTPVGTPAGIAAASLNRAGCRVVSQNPNLIAACDEGVSVDLLLEVYGQYPDKPAGYVISAARRIHAERASPVQTSLIPAGTRHAANRPSLADRAAEANRVHDEREQRRSG